ncbi:hypothetical protein STEG23_023818, partial [Scotinomys teguina]
MSSHQQSLSRDTLQNKTRDSDGPDRTFTSSAEFFTRSLFPVLFQCKVHVSALKTDIESPDP